MCTINEEENISARKEVKKLIKQLKEKIPEVENHIFKSVHNVNVSTFVGLKVNDQLLDFNDLHEGKVKLEIKKDND